MMNARVAIIIPARYASTRFPGKPLALLAGEPVLAHVVKVARAAAAQWDNIGVYVTSDDQRIADLATSLGVECIMTSPDCPTGTDRVRDAAQKISPRPEFVINLQGDAPLTPPDFVSAMLESYYKKLSTIITPVVRLSWQELDALRASKAQTPFSGTTVVMNAGKEALWFSKNIIPAIRKEKDLRAMSALSPVYRHIGLYGYEFSTLEKYVTLLAGHYEDLEGLEQLRALENGMTIQCVEVEYRGRPAMTGIDSPEDLARAEALLAS